jgi:hypothetical protein
VLVISSKEQLNEKTEMLDALQQIQIAQELLKSSGGESGFVALFCFLNFSRSTGIKLQEAEHRVEITFKNLRGIQDSREICFQYFRLESWLQFGTP